MLVVVPQLILVPYLLGTIGESGYGVYALVWPLLLSVERMHRSLQSGVVKYSAGFIAQHKVEKVNRVFSASFIYSIILGILAAAGTVAIAHFYQDSTGQINDALRIIAFMLLLIFPLTPFVAMVQARQRYFIETIADTVSKYVSLLIIYLWFELTSPSVLVVIVVMVSALFLSRLVQVPFAYRLVPGLKNRLRNFEWDSFKMIAGFGMGTIFAAISLGLNTSGLRWLMEILVSSSFVAQLAIMIMPASLMSDLINAMMITIMPATSAYQATGNLQLLKELFIRSMRYAVMILIPAGFTAVVLMADILKLWVGDRYIFLAPFTIILFLGQGIWLATLPASQILKGTGEIKKFVFSYWIGLVIIPLISILVLYSRGSDAYQSVTYGLSFGYLIGGAFQLYFGVDLLAIDIKDLLKRVFIQPVLAAVPLVGILILGMTLNIFMTIQARIIVTIVSLLAYGVILYFFIANEEERIQGKELVMNTWRRLRKTKVTNRR